STRNRPASEPITRTLSRSFFCGCRWSSVSEKRPVSGRAVRTVTSSVSHHLEAGASTVYLRNPRRDLTEKVSSAVQKLEVGKSGRGNRLPPPARLKPLRRGEGLAG